MRTLTTTTKQGEHFWQMYYHSKLHTLAQCYSQHSDAKRRAEAMCRATMNSEGGYDFRILSYNTFLFTCGWQLPNGDLRVETPTNSYVIYDLPF